MPQNTSHNLKPRPPIVVVMGHVDHGKTTLLDFIRKSNVAAREAGGITQSIGAYEITHAGKRMTFIDTPGHEAFSNMRSRGANAADLAILVVAAEEGIKPQTQESIDILTRTKTPFVVAITKIDKPSADIEKVKNELTAAGVLLEGYGGSISYQPVSAKSGENVNELLDLLLLAAELENLTYDPSAPAGGFVLETRLDRRRGMEASVIVKNGTLRFGDLIGTRTVKGKVKMLEDFQGKSARMLEPSAPALVVGFSELPQVGEEFVTGPEVEKLASPVAAPLNRTANYGRNAAETLNLILKAADMGSLEALSQIVQAMATEKPIQIVGQSVGEVTDNDVNLAISTGSMIIAFRSRVDKGAKILAESNKVKVIGSEIVYELVKVIEDALLKKEGAGATGTLQVLAVFNQAKLDKQLVGGRVIAGVIRNRTQFDIERNGAVIGSGRVGSLQHNKKDVAQVEEGKECGIMVGSAIALAEGDMLLIQ